MSAPAKTEEKDLPTSIPAIIEKFRPELIKVLPDFMTADRLIRVLVSQMRTVKGLNECTWVSLLKCFMQTAELGLEPGSALGLTYLIPYKKEATLIIGYQGMLEMVRRTGLMTTIEAHTVYKGDEFTYEFGDESYINHKPGPNYGKEDEDITHAYMVAKMTDGGVHREVMTRAEIDKIRERSKASGNGPWVTDFGQMAKKTVIRRSFKMLPKAIVPPVLHKALEVEDLAHLDDAGEDPDFEISEDAIDVEATIQGSPEDGKKDPPPKKDPPKEKAPPQEGTADKMEKNWLSILEKRNTLIKAGMLEADFWFNLTDFKGNGGVNSEHEAHQKIMDKEREKAIKTSYAWMKAAEEMTVS